MRYSENLSGFWDFLTEGVKAAGEYGTTQLDRDIAEINYKNNQAMQNIFGRNASGQDSNSLSPWIIGGIAAGAIGLTFLLVQK